jgi:carboxyl-terminal processing protease
LTWTQLQTQLAPHPQFQHPGQCTRVSQAQAAPVRSFGEVKAEENVFFGGIGAYVNADPNEGNRVTIVAPIEGTPAFDSGLQAGDVVEKIDNRDTQGMPIEQAVSLIRGTEGTVVHLDVYRPSTSDRFELDITRARIRTPRCPASAH